MLHHQRRSDWEAAHLAITWLRQRGKRNILKRTVTNNYEPPLSFDLCSHGSEHQTAQRGSRLGILPLGLGQAGPPPWFSLLSNDSILCGEQLIDFLGRILDVLLFWELIGG